MTTKGLKWTHILRVLPVAVAILVPGCSTSIDQEISGEISPIDRLQRQLKNAGHGVMVVAHRACWRLAPENSIKSIEECIRLGVDMVEIDVQQTRDGHLVVIHDDTVNRTTDGMGNVVDLTLAEVAALRLRAGQGGHGAPLTDQRVPTLEQALAAAKDRILVNLDVKANVRDESYRVADSLGVADQVLIKMSLASPDDANLADMAFFGRTYFMPIIREANGSLQEQVLSFDSIDPVAFEVIYESEKELNTACTTASAHQSRCWVNTMWERLSPGHSDDISVEDPDQHWGHLARLGVDMFQTDRPQELIEYLSDQGLR
jgi:glycerophosphoryl diester phosphodiesterase